MSVMITLAAREFRAGIRNRWVLAATVLLALLALVLVLLGDAPSGTLGADPIAVSVVSLASLSIYLLPLIALTLSFDAIVGEAESGTLMLLLSYPIRRWQVLFGKFLGHLAILAFATVVGYGLALVFLISSHDAPPSSEGLIAFGVLIGSSVILGAAFIAVGYVISCFASERTGAAGLALGTWLIFVVIYDIILLGLLVADQGQMIDGGVITMLIALNPADAYRILNMTFIDLVSNFSGMAGIANSTGLDPGFLILIQAGWIALPLFLAALILQRREI